MTLLIQPDGRLEFVWSDQLATFRDLGQTSIKRASHVEGTEDGRWTADMGPSGGPVLGPFELREQALTAEREWLAEHRGL